LDTPDLKMTINRRGGHCSRSHQMRFRAIPSTPLLVPSEALVFERHVRDCFATERHAVTDDVTACPVL
jgi:hypothetical protein